MQTGHKAYNKRRPCCVWIIKLTKLKEMANKHHQQQQQQQHE